MGGMEAEMNIASPVSGRFDTRRLAAIDAFLQDRYLDTGKLPHAQILIAQAGEIAHFSSLGPAREGEAAQIDERSLFRIASPIRSPLATPRASKACASAATARALASYVTRSSS